MSQLDKNNPASLDGERLHRFHDGELGAAERAEVEAALDDTARARLAALDDLGALLRATAEAEVGPGVTFDAWPALQKEIAASKVVSITSARKRRTVLWAGISTTVAAAAAAMVLFLVSPGSSAHAANNVELEEVDSDTGNVTIVAEPSEASGQVAIVWFSEPAAGGP